MLSCARPEIQDIGTAIGLLIDAYILSAGCGSPWVVCGP